MSKENNDYLITSVDRALSILDIFIKLERPLTLTEVAGETMLNKSTALRMLFTLKEREYLTYDEETKKYGLGVRALQLGLTALNGMDLAKIANPILQKATDNTGLVAHLGIYEDGNVIVLAKVLPTGKTSGIQLISHIGGLMPAYCTGIGRLFLAHENEEKVIEYLNNTAIQKYTSTTKTDFEEILAEIRRTRVVGYSINNGEHDEGIVSFCFPVYDHENKMIAGISLGGNRQVVSLAKDDDCFLEGSQAAREISLLLGWKPAYQK